METYIGVKTIKAKPMSYNEAIEKGYRVNDNLATEGYEVEYENSYKSWSPKDVFEKAYRRTTGLTFGLAIEAAKQGKKIARIGWNGSGMFAYIVPEEDCEKYEIEKEIFNKSDKFIVRTHWRLKTAQNDIASWAPSGSDSLAEDWVILN